MRWSRRRRSSCPWKWPLLKAFVRSNARPCRARPAGGRPRRRLRPALALERLFRGDGRQKHSGGGDSQMLRLRAGGRHQAAPARVRGVAPAGITRQSVGGIFHGWRRYSAVADQPSECGVPLHPGLVSPDYALGGAAPIRAGLGPGRCGRWKSATAEQNRGFIVDYAERHRHGGRVSIGFVESAVNQGLAERLVKRQQMQWTKQARGATARTGPHQGAQREVGSVFSAAVPRLSASASGAPTDSCLAPLPHTY